MKSAVPKQFLDLEGKPVLRRAVEPFLEFQDMQLILVLPEDRKAMWQDYCEKSGFLDFPYICASGGITRFHSVKNALQYVKPRALVAVHDGVRPFITHKFLESMVQLADSDKVLGLVPVLKVTDSLREFNDEDDGSHAVDRNRFVLVQTPQMFHSEVLLDSYSQPYSPAFTDDSSVVEARGYKLTLCSGLRGNIKITVPEDMERRPFSDQ